jgi:hypothetical protein
MRVSIVAALFTLGCASLAAQNAATTPAAVMPATPAANSNGPAKTTPALPPSVKDTDIGFSYSLPADWQAQASQQATPDVPYPTVEAPKKGNACAQVELTARKGTPFSVVVVIALPFDCYGQTLTAKNMPDLATGAAEGLKQTFEVVNPVEGNYTLGTHNMWVERASGTVKGQPQAKYTLEIACTVLTRGEACWLTMAADAAHLQAFERQPVTLEGDSFDALVPAGAVQAAAPPAASKPS